MANYRSISIENLRQLLVADFEAGKLFWKPRPNHAQFNSCFAGCEAFTGGNKKGLMGAVMGIHLRAHRVVWAMHCGRWPDGDIDHINQNPHDNRICNLREVSTAQNSRNCKRSVSNKSGFTGVLYEPKSRYWIASIGIGARRRKYLGKFRNKEDAIATRLKAEREYGYDPKHGKTAPVAFEAVRD